MSARAALAVTLPRAAQPQAARLPRPEPVQEAAALLAAVPVACALLDADDHFRVCNPAAEQFFSLSQSQLRHLSLADLIPADNPVFLMLRQVREHAA